MRLGTVRSTFALCCFWLVGGLVAQAPAGASAKAPPTAESFDRDIQTLSAAAKRGAWTGLKSKLEALLHSHERATYVRARQEEIELLHRSATFRERRVPPDPKTLVSGNLLTWEPSTGRIKIEYSASTMGDWLEDKTVFPAPFSGSHSIEIKVKRYPSMNDEGAKVPGLLVCATEDRYFAVLFGLPRFETSTSYRWAPATIRRGAAGGEPTDLASIPEGICAAGAPCTLKVSVSETTLTAFVGGKQILTAKKKSTEWGSLVVRSVGEIERILVEGKITSSWMRGLIDKHDADSRKKFDETYKPSEAGLPDWLYETARVGARAKTRAEGADALNAAPEELNAEQNARLQSIHKMPSVTERIRALEDATDEQLPPATRFTMLGELRTAREEFAAAAVAFQSALKTAPDALRPRFGLGGAHFEDGAYASAADVLRPLVLAAPSSVEVVELLIYALLFAEKAEDAKKVREDAKALGVESPRLDEVGKLLAKALHGPDWPKRFTSRTDRYEVATDLDQRTADEAGRVLEESYRAYGDVFGRPKTRGAPRARVFLFSGEESYSRYAADLTGSARPHTAGLYSRLIKQLLIWNLPSREAMMRTVRHEGFHQFLDRAMRDPPIWFNEGFAEYFETVRIENGKWTKGVARKDHLARMKRPMPLAEFVNIDRSLFYADAAGSYAQAWTVAHFFLHAGPDARRAFDRLVRKLLEGASAARAIEDALPERTLGTLEHLYRLHLLALNASLFD